MRSRYFAGLIAAVAVLACTDIGALPLSLNASMLADSLQVRAHFTLLPPVDSARVTLRVMDVIKSRIVPGHAVGVTVAFPAPVEGQRVDIEARIVSYNDNVPSDTASLTTFYTRPSSKPPMPRLDSITVELEQVQALMQSAERMYDVAIVRSTDTCFAEYAGPDYSPYVRAIGVAPAWCDSTLTDTVYSTLGRKNWFNAQVSVWEDSLAAWRGRNF